MCIIFGSVPVTPVNMANGVGLGYSLGARGRGK